MVSKRCKSIWNLVIKHTHKKCRWVSSELRLSYVFFLKVQKKSYKNKKSYQRKRKKKKVGRKWGKKVTSLNISPHLFLLFTLLSGKTRNGNSHSRLPLLEDMPRATAQCHAIDVLTHIHHLFHITQCAELTLLTTTKMDHCYKEVTVNTQTFFPGEPIHHWQLIST